MKEGVEAGFWKGEKLEIAKMCEEKNTSLFYDNLQRCYFVVKKFDDGSVLHSRETELFTSESIKEVRTFIEKYVKPSKNNTMPNIVKLNSKFEYKVPNSDSKATIKGTPWESLMVEGLKRNKKGIFGFECILTGDMFTLEATQKLAKMVNKNWNNGTEMTEEEIENEDKI